MTEKRVVDQPGKSLPSDLRVEEISAKMIQRQEGNTGVTETSVAYIVDIFTRLFLMYQLYKIK